VTTDDAVVPTVPTARGGAVCDRADVASLARALTDVCDAAGTTSDHHEVVVALAHAALSGLPGAEATGMSLGSPEAPTVVGYAGELAAALDADQLRRGGGPTFLAEQTGEAVVCDDLATDDRWPRLALLARGGSARSVLVVPVRANGAQVGLLTCCSAGVQAFGPGQRDAAGMLASAAGSVLAGLFERERLATRAENLDRALLSRQEIDEAKGVVMARHACTPDEAFAYLTALSQRENVKLRVIAHRVVAQAQLPDDDPSARRARVSRRRS